MHGPLDVWVVRTPHAAPADADAAPDHENADDEASKPTALELFAGCGGMAIGLEQAGFAHRLLVERNRAAVRTLRINGMGQHTRHVDAARLDYTPWRGSVDLVAGGPPCQPFSNGGFKQGEDDPRDGWPIAIRAVAEIKPRAFLFENVYGMLRARFEDYTNSVVARFDALGYTTTLHAVDAADYGVPQRRRRVFVVGFRNDTGAAARFVPPPPTTAGCHVTVAEMFADLGPATGQNGHYPPYHLGSKLHKAAKTLVDRGGGLNMVQLNEEGAVRYFTGREMARLQSFPDSFKLPLTWAHVNRQLSNACPVVLARVFGEAVRAALDAPMASPA